MKHFFTTESGQLSIGLPIVMLALSMAAGLFLTGCPNSSDPATVTISGTPKEGETLTAVIHDGYSFLTPAYQWMRASAADGAPVDIGGGA